MLDYNLNKMKIKQYIYVILAGSLAVASCKKQFLDEKPPTAVPVTLAIKTENDMADAVNGMYNAMRQYTFLGRDIPILGDELADNTYVYGTNSGRYLQEMNYTFISTNAEANDIWSQGYYSILQANRIIYAASSFAGSNNVNQLKGEAYIARALCYLELVNFFATPFAVNPNADGVPLVTTPTFVTGPFVKPARASVTAVYNKIISDLDSAYAIMPTTAITLHGTTSEYLSKYAAKAIESRALLYKGDYAGARDAALVVVNSGGYSLASAASLPAYWANPAPTSTKLETVFELALNTATNNGTNGLDYFYNQAGYGDALAYTDLYNLYSATDARRNLFLTTSTTKPGTVYVVNKYANVTNANDKDDVKVIRYAEVLLTLAEAYARSGDEPDALVTLNKLAQQRDPAFLGYVSTGSQLISDILTERRKELAFEGLRFFDLTRTAATITRPAQGNTATSLSTIAPGDNRRILPIPQAEIDANPSIKQNPGY
jgi:tetratricopeptide (TPR) repeat protein